MAQSEWQQSNPKRVREIVSQWRKDNPEKAREHRVRAYAKRKALGLVTAYSRKYWKENKEKIRQRKLAKHDQRLAAYRKWANNNREKIRAKQKMYRQRYPGKMQEKRQAYRAKKLKAVPLWADTKAMKRIYCEARRLTQETGIPHNVDHIVPLRSNVVHGFHCEANLHIVTATANNLKSNKYWPDMP